jgi:2-polyprenyl-6-methoxyphenol hydroxylase-like FAD-dependent oxidoreductase
MAHIVVIGGGVSGLSAALKFGRVGHRVTLIERDDTPMPETAEAAFEWDRRGAPQVRHSHAFLARLVHMLKAHEPDVYEQLLGAGASEMRFGDNLPPTITDFERLPSDNELTLLACRRTTFEWVMRRAALAEGQVTLRTGAAVTGLVSSGGCPPLVTGVRLDGTETLECDLVVCANGRRSDLPSWLAAIGSAEVAEEVDDTGIVYSSRFYRFNDGAEIPERSGLIGGDLGFIKYGVFLGDNGSFSLTLATPTDDDELRRVLADPANFESAARSLDVAAPYVDGRATPLTPVHIMAGLLNRWRDLVVDGRPLALGIHAIGDAVLCTNPLYGRGCTTGNWSAHLLAEAVAAHPHDLAEQARQYDAALRAEIVPWYKSGVLQDREARRVAAALLAGEDPDGDPEDPRTFMRAVFREGLVPALRFDVHVLRAFVRNLNLLSPPDALMNDPDVSARVLAVWQDRENRPPEPRLGPASRDELLSRIAA